MEQNGVKKIPNFIEDECTRPPLCWTHPQYFGRVYFVQIRSQPQEQILDKTFYFFVTEGQSLTTFIILADFRYQAPKGTFRRKMTSKNKNFFQNASPQPPQCHQWHQYFRRGNFIQIDSEPPEQMFDKMFLFFES